MRRLIFFLAFLLSISLVCAVPDLPHQFYGDISGDAYVLVASVDGVDFTTDITSSQYGYDPVFMILSDDDSTSSSEGGEDGDNIEFFIDGASVANYTFDSGVVTKLDLTVTTTADTSGADVDTDDDDDNNGNSRGSDDDEECEYDSDCADGFECHYKECIYVGTNETNTSCANRWDCTGWSECSVSGIQTRECTYIGDCDSEGASEDLTQECEYDGHCGDGIMNGQEEGVDCGGPCEPCYYTGPAEEIVEEHCGDGILNQDEEDVDCGGVCYPCSSNLGLIVGIIVAIILLAGLGTLAYVEKDEIKKMFEKKPKGPMPTAPITPGPPSPNKPQINNQDLYKKQ